MTNNYYLEDSVSWSNVLFTIDIAVFWINVFICCTITAGIMTFLKKLNYTSFSSIFEILSYTYSWMYDFTSKYRSFQKLNYRLTLFELSILKGDKYFIFQLNVLKQYYHFFMSRISTHDFGQLMSWRRHGCYLFKILQIKWTIDEERDQ